MKTTAKKRRLTEEQADYICDLQDEEGWAKGLSMREIAARLAAEGHPLFVERAPEPEPEPALAATPRAPAQPERDPREREIPDLDAGPPVRVEVMSSPEAPAVAPRSATGLADPRQVAGLGVEGLEGVTQRDLVVPTLALKQAQTETSDDPELAAVPDGHWFLTHDPSDHGGREIAFLRVSPGRAFLLPYRDEDRDDLLEELGLARVVPDDVQVICSSPDRISPVPREEQTWPCFAQSCSTCPHAQWRTTAGGRRRPPLCGEQYRCLVADLTHGDAMPARMLLRSSAIRPMKALLTAAAIAAKRHRVPLWGLSVPLSSVQRSGKGGTYYVPAFGRPQAIQDPGLVEELGALREGLLASQGVEA